MESVAAPAPVAERPLGFWLKRLDQLIEDAFSEALAEDGLSRRHWQVLNVVSSERVTTPQLAQLLGSFDGSDGVAAVISELTDRGWLSQTASGEWALTADGLRAHGHIAERVADVRDRMAAGIGQRDYRTTQSVLEAMCANLSAG